MADGGFAVAGGERMAGDGADVVVPGGLHDVGEVGASRRGRGGGGHFGGIDDEVVCEGVGALGVIDAGVADSGEDVVGGAGDVEEPVCVAGGILGGGVGGFGVAGGGDAEMVAVGGECFEAVPEGLGDVVGGGDGAEAAASAFESFGCGGVVDFMSHGGCSRRKSEWRNSDDENRVTSDGWILMGDEGNGEGLGVGVYWRVGEGPRKGKPGGG